jgi:hypothetical protein
MHAIFHEHEGRTPNEAEQEKNTAVDQFGCHGGVGLAAKLLFFIGLWITLAKANHGKN